MNINHERLVPGAITYWGDVVGDITDQQDLVDYVASHGGGGSGDATWGSIQGTLSNQTDLNDRLTGLDQYDLDNYNFTKDVSNSLTDHIAANDAAFAEAFSRISALEQGGVSQQDFDQHVAQNAAQFQVIDNQFQVIDNQFQDYATNQRANELYQANFGYITATRNELSQSIQDVADFVKNNAVTTEQCQEPGLTDYMLTSLIWTNNNVILAMDDYYTGDNAENRDVTIWGSYMDVDDDSRVKFGKVKTTYEQDPNTQEYTVTGQTFGEMMTLTRKEGIDFPVVDRPNDDGGQDDYNSDGYILSLSERYDTIEEDGDEIGRKTVGYIVCEDQDLVKRQLTYYNVDGEWELQNELESQPVFTGNGWDVAWIHILTDDPEYQGRLDDFPIEGYVDTIYDKLPFGINQIETGPDGEALVFSGFCWDQVDEKLGLYKVTPNIVPGVGFDGYDETFIPFVAAEEPDTSTDGTYILKATVQDGEVTYSWVPDNVL